MREVELKVRWIKKNFQGWAVLVRTITNQTYRQKEDLSNFEPFGEMQISKPGEARDTESRAALSEGSTPFCSQQYWGRPQARQVKPEPVDEMLRSGILTQSQSECALPVDMVPGKDGNPRFCVDYRRQHTVSVCDSHPVSSNSIKTLTCHVGTKLFQKMPTELKKAPAKFLRMLVIMPSQAEYRWCNCLM